MPKDRIDFVVAGAQRSGTTTVDAMLRSLPGVLMPRKKELHFFDDDRNFPEGDGPDLGLYHAQWDFDWKAGPAGILLGEVTPEYLYWPASIQRLRAYRSDLKIICVLREPVGRAFSHWNMNVQRRRERLSFDEAIRVERKRIDVEINPPRWAYVDRGRYPKQIERLRAAFPSERLLFLRFEDLTLDPTSTRERLAGFLGVEASNQSPASRRNAIRYDGAMHPSTGHRLLEELEADIRRTGELLDWDITGWLRPQGSIQGWFMGEVQRRSVNLLRSARWLLTRQGRIPLGRPGDRPAPLPYRPRFGSDAAPRCEDGRPID